MPIQPFVVLVLSVLLLLAYVSYRFQWAVKPLALAIAACCFWDLLRR